jgi:hypothetical protein
MKAYDVELQWLLEDARGDVRSIVIRGRVRGAAVSEFGAVDDAGRPIAFPAAHLDEAHRDLVDAARELWRAP